MASTKNHLDEVPAWTVDRQHSNTSDQISPINCINGVINVTDSISWQTSPERSGLESGNKQKIRRDGGPKQEIKKRPIKEKFVKLPVLYDLIIRYEQLTKGIKNVLIKLHVFF